MKTNKEYPATHSMSTAWFAADEDGNVAIFDFNENGPIPQCAPMESSIQEIITETFASIDKDIPCSILNITDQQAIDLFNHCTQKGELSSTEDYIGECLIKIDTKREKDFFEIIKRMGQFNADVICFSRNNGLYYVSDLIDFPKTMLDIIQDIFRVPLFPDEFGDGFSINFDQFPFFIYAQPYCIENPMQRLILPNLPAKVSQLPLKIQKLICHLPIRFSEHNYLQIADYFPTKLNHDFEEFVEYEVSPDKKLTFGYHLLPDEIGITYYYLTDFINDLNAISISTSFYPTVFVFSDSPIDHNKIGLYGSKYFAVDIIPDNVQYDFCDYYLSIKETIESSILFLCPHLFFVSDLVLPILEKHYKLDNHQITINDQTFPYFLFSEIESHHEEIMDYANREYRGIKIPIKLTENELQKLETSVD